MSSVSPTRGLGPPSFPDRHERGGDDGGVVGDAITHEARLRLAFDAIDIDGSNSVGKRELYDALRRVGVRGTESQMLGLFRDAHHAVGHAVGHAGKPPGASDPSSSAGHACARSTSR